MSAPPVSKAASVPRRAAQDEVPLWFRTVSLYVAPMRSEGFGLTPLEAMASGTAVVATKTGAAPLLIAEGETGTLIEPDSLDALVSAIEPFLSDPEKAETFDVPDAPRPRRNTGLPPKPPRSMRSTKAQPRLNTRPARKGRIGRRCPASSGAPVTSAEQSAPGGLAQTEAPKAGQAALIFIFATVVLDVLAMGIVIPVLPKLVETFEGGDTASAARIYGWFGTAWAAMQFLFMPILGSLSDKYGRRPVLLISLAGHGLDFVLMALAPNLVWLFVGRLLSGITSASFSVAMPTSPM